MCMCMCMCMCMYMFRCFRYCTWHFFILQRKYHVVLETVLSAHFYKFSTSEVTVVTDKDKHITLQFHAEVGCGVGRR